MTKEEINNIIPSNFRGKDVFIQLYSIYNGVYFPNGAWVKIYHSQRAEDDEDEGLEIEFIYSLEHLTKMWNVLKNRSNEAKKFVETHIPFARDAAGNEFFIEINSGVIKYISWEDGLTENITDIAPDFKEFCMAIEPLDSEMES